jgi:NADPH:quinone reductase-like Zn-dependent oxidoreductase
MRAIVIDRYGGPEVLRETELPVPQPRPGEIRVRIRAIGINPVDYKMRRGAGAPQPDSAQSQPAPLARPASGDSLPLVLGRDVAGDVDALGAGVAGIEIGERVFGALLGPRSNGAYAQYACAPLAFFGPKPGALSYVQAAAVPVAGMTAYVSLIHKARLRAGERLFVAGGAGGVGVFALPLAKRLGAEAVLTTAGSAASEDFLVRELHVAREHILRYDGLTLEEMARRVLAMNGGRPVPLACDFVGGTMKRLCARVLDFDGQLVTAVEEPQAFDLNVWSARGGGTGSAGSSSASAGSSSVSAGNGSASAGGGSLRARSASVHLVNLGARARDGGPAEWETYRDALASLSHWLDTGHIPPPPVTVVGALGEASVREAHARLESGHTRGKLVLTVE